MSAYIVIRPGGMSWRDGKHFAEGQIITSDDLMFPLREKQLAGGRWLKLVEESAPVEASAVEALSMEPEPNLAKRPRGRPAKRNKGVSI